jgi:hypothetical protein
VYSYIADRARLTPQPDAKLSKLPQPDETGVTEPCAAYQRMQPHWDVIQTVKGGTAAIRTQGEAYLPIEPFEKHRAYDRRRDRACLSPWYARLVRGLVGMMLRKPVQLQDVSGEVEEHLDNINLLGDDLNHFAAEVFTAAIDHGYTGVFIDYPNSDGIATLADQVERGDRPYWIHYTAPEIIGWRYQVVGNRRVFTQLRIKQTVTEPAGDFGDQEIEQILVYDLAAGRCRHRLFRQVNDRWQAVSETWLSLSFIPFVFVYTTPKKDLTAPPPMLEIAYLNIRHYQISADLDHALHIAAHPKLVLYGYDCEQGNINVGADEALVFDNPEGRAEWIAPQLSSFAAQTDRLTAIEGQIAALGLSSLVGQKNVGESAEAKKLDRTQGDSMMAVIAQSLQDAFDICLEYHAAYLGEAPGTCQINRDFNLAALTPQEIDSFSRLHSAGQISLETLLELLKRGEVFDDEFAIADELERLETEMQRQSQTMLPDLMAVDPTMAVDSTTEPPQNEQPAAS